MQEIIYKIDNWTLVKLIGGITIVLTAIIGFFSKYFLATLTQASQHSYNSNIEKIKGDIAKNNSLLTSLAQNHLSTSQKILDKKIQAYEIFWNTILKIRDSLPSGISLVYHMLTDEELAKQNAFERLNNNPKMGPLLGSYELDVEMQKIISVGKPPFEFRPYISDNSFKIYYTYHGLIGRITHQFIREFNNKIIYNWKEDAAVKDLLKVTLTEKEIGYIMNLKFMAFNALSELIEYKVLQDFRTSLSIKDSANDTIEYLKDIETLFQKK